MESNIELITGVCSTVAEARADLEATLAEVAPVAESLGLGLLCAGTHPFSDWAAQDITPDERYHRLVEEVQWPARRMAIFGIHTHVGVRSAEKAIAIANALTAYIPHFLALSASSPWFEGRDTGLASSRMQGVRGAAHRRAARPAGRLGGVLRADDHPDRGQGHQLHPGDLVGHPAPPELRDGRAADLRRPPDDDGDRHRRRPGPVPGGVDGHAHRPGLQAALPQGGGSSGRTSGGRPATASTPS